MFEPGLGNTVRPCFRGRERKRKEQEEEEEKEGGGDDDDDDNNYDDGMEKNETCKF